MYHLPASNKKMLTKNINRHKKMNFHGKGANARLAAEIGVAPQTVSNWLNGSRLPTMSQLYELSKVFNVSPLKLCGLKEGCEYNTKTAHLILLEIMLNYRKTTIELNVNPRVVLKTLTKFKELVIKELDE